MFGWKGNKNDSLDETKRIKWRLVAYLLFLVLLVAGGVTYQNPLPLIDSFPGFSRDVLFTLFYWICVIALVVAIIRLFNQLWYAQQLDQESIPTPGTITKRWENHGADYTDFHLSFSYLNGQQKADASVPSKVYRSAREGDQVQVFYLPHKPEISRLDLSSLPERTDPASTPIALRPTPMRGHKDSRKN
jgi:hypothetical protein